MVSETLRYAAPGGSVMFRYGQNSDYFRMMF